MYIHLSDRKRRIFLSNSQNFFPKKALSFKDKRFLQKRESSQTLTSQIFQQQKILHEKISLKAPCSFLCNLSEKRVLALENRPESSSQKSFFSQVTKKGVYLQQFSLKEKFIKTAEAFLIFKPPNNFDRSVQKNRLALFIQTIKKRACHVPYAMATGAGGSAQPKAPAQLYRSLSKKKIKAKVEESRRQEQIKGGVQLAIGPGQRAQEAAIKPESLKLVSSDKTPLPFSALRPKKFKPTKLLDKPSIRFLYDHESLKTRLAPQITKNQKPISRLSLFSHEKKKN